MCGYCKVGIGEPKYYPIGCKSKHAYIVQCMYMLRNLLAAPTVISGNEGLICGPRVVDEQLWVRHQVGPQPRSLTRHHTAAASLPHRRVLV